MTRSGLRGVGDHDPGELLGRGLGHRAFRLVGDAGVHEEQVEPPVRPAGASSAAICAGSVMSTVSISSLSGLASGEVVQRGPAGAAHGR